jgi:ribosomal RNA-processing protein 9
MDRVAMIDEEMFVTGGDNGSLSLWTMHKKKPIFTLPLSHGMDTPLAPEEASAETKPDRAIVPQPQPRWITALATIPYSDVILSGSWDGQVRAWRVSDDKKKIESLNAIGTSELNQPVARGVVNDIAVFERGERAKDGISVVLAMGKEHRMGRWKKVPGRNGLVVLEVSRKERTNGMVEGEVVMMD